MLPPGRLSTALDLLEVATDLAFDLEAQSVEDFLVRDSLPAQRVADAFHVAQRVPIIVPADSPWAGLDHAQWWSWISSTIPAAERDLREAPTPATDDFLGRRALAIVVIAFARIERMTGHRPGATR